MILYIHLLVDILVDLVIIPVKVNPQEQPNQKMKMEIADSVLLSMFMRDIMKSAASVTPPRLSGIQLSFLNLLE